MGFESGHRDVVTMTRFNFYGNRIVTASSDHRVRVWDLDPDRKLANAVGGGGGGAGGAGAQSTEGKAEKEKSGQDEKQQQQAAASRDEKGMPDPYRNGDWQLIDTWRAHDAEVRDVAWTAPFIGQYIGTIGEDKKFRLWQEDVAEPLNSGRRFSNCFSMTSPARTPYVSMDFYTIALESSLALITRDGLLTVLEPVNPDSLHEWQQVDQFRVCPEPARGQETSFKLQFHKDPVDYTKLAALPSWDARSLSLVIAAMDRVHIYNAGADRKFHYAVELAGHGGSLVRDVSWATGSVRGFDLVASGCKDGNVRIWEVYTSLNPQYRHHHHHHNHGYHHRGRKTLGDEREYNRGNTAYPTSAHGTASSRAGFTQSGLGSALSSTSQEGKNANPDDPESPFIYTAKQVADIDSRHLDVWQVDFAPSGEFASFLF